MKTLLSAAVLVSALLFIGRLQADTIVVGFEEEYASKIGNDNSWKSSGDFSVGSIISSKPTTSAYGAAGTEVVYQSGGAAFSVASGVDSFPWWSGTALSTRTDKTSGEWYDDGNDLLSVTGSGNGSKTYAVVYGDSETGLLPDSDRLPRISLPTDALLQSIAITNTAYTYNSLTFGDGSAEALSDSSGSYFKLHIYGIDSDGGLAGTLTVDLGTYADGALNYWKTVDFLDDFAGAVELRFAFDGSSVSYGWLNHPAYVAIDNLTFSVQNNETPEPATLLIFGAGLAGLGLLRKRG